MQDPHLGNPHSSRLSETLPFFLVFENPQQKLSSLDVQTFQSLAEFLGSLRSQQEFLAQSQNSNKHLLNCLKAGFGGAGL